MGVQHLVDWSAEWKDEGRVWILNLIFEENGEKYVRTTIECRPDDKILSHIKKRTEEGLGAVARDALILLVSDVMNNWGRFQFLVGTKPAEDKFTLGDRHTGGEAEVIIRSEKLNPNLEDKIVYFKEVPNIFKEILTKNSDNLPRAERRRYRRLAWKSYKKLEKKRPSPQLVTLDPRQNFYFYVDESGDSGLREGASEFYSAAALAVKSENAESMSKELRELVERFTPGARELKFSKVDGYTRDDLRETIYRECIRILNQNVFIAFGFSIHKEGYLNEKARVAMSMYYFGSGDLPDFDDIYGDSKREIYQKELFSSPAGYLAIVCGRLMIDTRRRGRIIYDRLNRSKETLINAEFIKFLSVLPNALETLMNVKCSFDLPLDFRRSEAEPGIWLAELAAREINKTLSGSESRVVDFVEKFGGTTGYEDGIILLTDKSGKCSYYDLRSKSAVASIPD